MIAVAESPPAQSPAPPPTQAEIIDRLQQTVSASRLTLFLSCRLKFFFRYVARLKKARTAALHVGGSVHAVLKAWNKSRWRREPLTLKQLHDEFVKAWADQKDETVQWAAGKETEENKVAWRLVETYIRESKIPPELVPDAVEVPVEADLHEHGLPTLIGVLDLVQGGIIVDYKTSGQTPNADRAVHTNEVQTSGYAVLYRASTGKKETGIEVHTLVKLKTPKLVFTPSPPMSEQQQTRLFRLIEAYQHGLDVRDFIPSPGLQCVSCEFFNECRAWS
jgi:putative RecB family exonuclease